MILKEAWGVSETSQVITVVWVGSDFTCGDTRCPHEGSPGCELKLQGLATGRPCPSQEPSAG